jgi:hypothetical protein
VRLLVATVCSFLILCGAALGAGGPVILGGAWGGDGPSGPGPKPGSEFRYVAVGSKPTLVERISIADGSVGRVRWLEGSWALPAVTVRGEAGGLSADGRTLVLVRPGYQAGSGRTTMLLFGTERFETSERISLDGTFGFDAVSPDGRRLYLIQYRDPRDPLDYRVRQYDVTAGELEPGAIVDPDEPDEKMTGQPVSRKASNDGRWVYTLYGGGEETFVHALDTERGIAQCIDLEGFPRNAAYQLRLEIDRATGELTVLDKNDPAAAIDPQTFAVTPLATQPASSSTDGGGDADWVGAAAVGSGIALLAATTLLLLRRRRATA